MKKAVILIGILVFIKVNLFSQVIDYESVDTTKIPNGLFSELVDKFHGQGDTKVLCLEYDNERNYIIYAIEWKGYLEAGKDLMLIEPTDSGLVRRILVTYSPDYEFHYDSNYLYIKSWKSINVYDMNELSKPIYFPILNYKFISRLGCYNDNDYECVNIEISENNKVILKRKNKSTNAIVEEIYFIENGKFIKI